MLRAVRTCNRKKTLYRQVELKFGACTCPPHVVRVRSVTGDSEHVPLGPPEDAVIGIGLRDRIWI